MSMLTKPHLYSVNGLDKLIGTQIHDVHERGKISCVMDVHYMLF